MLAPPNMLAILLPAIEECAGKGNRTVKKLANYYILIDINYFIQTRKDFVKIHSIS